MATDTGFHLFRSASDVASAARETTARVVVAELEAELVGRGVDLEAPRLPAGSLGSALVCYRDALYAFGRVYDRAPNEEPIRVEHATSAFLRAECRARTGLAHLR